MREFSRSHWSRALVDESIDNENDVAYNATDKANLISEDLRNVRQIWANCKISTVISRKVVGKKAASKCTRQAKTERLHGYSLELAYWPSFAYWPSLYFCTWRICFSSQGPISLALLLLSHVFE